LPESRDFRRRIAIDDRILALLGERFAVIRELAVFTAPRGPLLMALEPEFLRRLYTLIIDEACRLEDRLMSRRDLAGSWALPAELP